MSDISDYICACAPPPAQNFDLMKSLDIKIVKIIYVRVFVGGKLFPVPIHPHPNSHDTILN